MTDTSQAGPRYPTAINHVDTTEISADGSYDTTTSTLAQQSGHHDTGDHEIRPDMGHPLGDETIHRSLSG